MWYSEPKFGQGVPDLSLSWYLTGRPPDVESGKASQLGSGVPISKGEKVCTCRAKIVDGSGW